MHGVGWPPFNLLPRCIGRKLVKAPMENVEVLLVHWAHYEAGQDEAACGAVRQIGRAQTYATFAKQALYRSSVGCGLLFN